MGGGRFRAGDPLRPDVAAGAAPCPADRSIGEAPGTRHRLLDSATLSVPVPDGVYQVTVHAGDMLYSREQMAVTIEGTSTTCRHVAGQVIATTFRHCGQRW